jgi:hypothetical protein
VKKKRVFATVSGIYDFNRLNIAIESMKLDPDFLEKQFVTVRFATP